MRTLIQVIQFNGVVPFNATVVALASTSERYRVRVRGVSSYSSALAVVSPHYGNSLLFLYFRLLLAFVVLF
jgi:hypothetical protein